MHRALLILTATFGSVTSVYTYDYDENTPRQFIEKLNEQSSRDGIAEPEPTNTLTTQSNNTSLNVKNILCEDFEEYTGNCTYHAKLIHNSTNSPPLPKQLSSYCAALKYLTNCENDWNIDCKDITEKSFDVDIIKGQFYVIDSICHDNWFSKRYDATLGPCIKAIAYKWKLCYMKFKSHTDQHRNSTNNWTHYKTHFYLCCARIQFCRCTLEVLLNFSSNCAPQQTIILQKFSSILSEGVVFQDCNFNMVYPNCPGGDPRPPRAMITKLMGIEDHDTKHFINSAPQLMSAWFLFVPFILLN